MTESEDRKSWRLKKGRMKWPSFSETTVTYSSKSSMESSLQPRYQSRPQLDHHQPVRRFLVHRAIRVARQMNLLITIKTRMVKEGYSFPRSVESLASATK